MPPHDPPQLFLVDGHALIYRAFYALIARPLRTSRGENTSAAWGIVNFLLRLREKYTPEYLVWVMDAGDSFRKTRYPDYKSTREKLDEQLQQDFDLAITQVNRLLAAFRIPVLSVAGYEADDVIGTLARRFASDGKQIVIVSGDKDFYQLVGPRIALLNPGRGGAAGVEEHWVDESNAAERLGVPPSQVTDWLALVGDSSDNVPGVKGIGEKGAVQLLQEFGSLEALLARAGEVKAKRPREALAQFAEDARLSKELVTIRTDVPVELDLGRAESRTATASCDSASSSSSIRWPDGSAARRRRRPPPGPPRPLRARMASWPCIRPGPSPRSSCPRRWDASRKSWTTRAGSRRSPRRSVARKSSQSTPKPAPSSP